MTASGLMPLLVIALLLWRAYSRIRRLVGRQRSTLRRHWIGIVVFSLLTAFLAVGALAHPLSLAGLGLGLALGTALAIWGLSLTRFEANSEGWFYTPNAHIGVAISLIMVARILYRLLTMVGMASGESRVAALDFVRSPLTLIAFGTLAAYYIAFAVGVLRWRHRVKLQRKAASPTREPTPVDSAPDTAATSAEPPPDPPVT